MFIAEVTRFHLPDGRQTIEKIGLEDHLEDKYNEITQLGLRFTVEILRNKEVSVCLEDPELGDILIEIVKMPTSLPPVFEKMLTKFDKEKYEHWKELMEK